MTMHHTCLVPLLWADPRTVLTTVILAAASLALLAVAVGWVLGWANRRFHVETDPKVDAIQDALPGANCGGCGFVGCREYAEAVAAGTAKVDLCGPGGTGSTEALADLMGVSVTETYPYKAVVHCSARWKERLQRTEYRGEATCASANLVSGYQGCTYGCLGLGDCVRACAYEAMHIDDGLAVIDYEKCVGCKACKTACPRNIISIVPFKSERMLVVACSNQDMGPDVKAVCKTGCIGCKACTRVSDHLTMQGSTPVIDYERYDPEFDFLPVIDKCPMESLVFVGVPTLQDMEATADEELPAKIEADFKTTVDDTEWWG